MPENWQRTMSVAVPRWQFDSESPLAASHLMTNQQVRFFQECTAFWHPRCISPEREEVAMSGMQSLNGLSDSQSQLSGSRSSILKIDSWMPSKIQAISPLVGRLMRLMEGSQSVPGEEPDVSLPLREALGNPVMHGNQEDPGKKVHIQCLCWPGKGISGSGKRIPLGQNTR